MKGVRFNAGKVHASPLKLKKKEKKNNLENAD